MKLIKTSIAAAVIAIMALTSSVSMAQTEYEFNVGAAIPDDDAAGLTDVQNIFGVGTITDVDVGLDIDHTWQGDLIVTLEHDGVTVPLFYRPGDSNGVGAGYAADNLGGDTGRFILDDEAAEAYDTGDGWGSTDDPGIADVEGSWIPYGQFGVDGSGGLNAFDGLSDSGDWTLVVSDNNGFDTGTLNSWSLIVTATAVPEPSSMAVLMMGMSGLAFVRRRRK